MYTFLLGILLLFCGCNTDAKGLSDSQIRQRVVLIEGDHGACTGVQVEALSHKKYILTAAHCRDISKKGLYRAVTENGKAYQVSIVQEDLESDLMLLTPITRIPAILVAKSSHIHDNIRTFTHGHRFRTYKTSGVIIQDAEMAAPIHPIITPDQAVECLLMPKYKLSPDGEFCELNVPETYTTALIVPGSSGGPVVDWKGRLVGIVSATSDGFGAYVRLGDIHRFLSKF